MANTLNIFISHSWSYYEHYDKLSEWIFDENWSVNGISISFFDFSVPRDDPIHYAKNSRELQEKIFTLIKNCHVVVIPMGIYASYSKWIQKEIDGSNYYGIPILAVNPWGQERKSSVVAQSAASVVGWNKNSVVDGIWQLCR